MEEEEKIIATFSNEKPEMIYRYYQALLAFVIILSAPSLGVYLYLAHKSSSLTGIIVLSLSLAAIFSFFAYMHLVDIFITISEIKISKRSLYLTISRFNVPYSCAKFKIQNVEFNLRRTSRKHTNCCLQIITPSEDFIINPRGDFNTETFYKMYRIVQTINNRKIKSMDDILNPETIYTNSTYKPYS